MKIDARLPKGNEKELMAMYFETQNLVFTAPIINRKMHTLTNCTAGFWKIKQLKK